MALPKFYKSATRLSARLAQIDLTSQSTRMKAVLNTLMNKIKVANTGGVEYVKNGFKLNAPPQAQASACAELLPLICPVFSIGLLYLLS